MVSQFFFHFIFGPWFHHTSISFQSVAINPVPGLEVGWCTLHRRCNINPNSVSGDPLNHGYSLGVILLTKGAAHWSLCSLSSLHQSFKAEGEKICIFNAKWAELLLRTLTTNQFHYSVFCLQLEEMLDKMSKIKRACESGCQSSPDGHFTNRSESQFVWQLCSAPSLTP